MEQETPMTEVLSFSYKTPLDSSGTSPEVPLFGSTDGCRVSGGDTKHI